MYKVAFVIPSLGGGGAEKVLVNLVNNMCSDKFAITVIALFDSQVNTIFLADHINYKYIFKKPISGNSRLQKLFSPKQLYKYIVRDDYDIVVSYLQGVSSRIVGGCPNQNSKTIAWLHNEFDDIKQLTKYYRNKSEFSRLHKKFNAIVGVSQTVIKSFAELTDFKSDDLYVCYNTNDVNKILKQSLEFIEEIDFDPEKLNLISMGRFAKQKGYNRLLDILGQLKKENKDFHLYLMGDGKLKSDYLKSIEINNIKDNVTFLGYQQNPYKFLRHADLFVCSSYHEGFSTAVSESLIVGTPVITTDCSGMEEIFGRNNEYGIIVDNNEQALLEGIRKFFDDKHLLSHLESNISKAGKKFSVYNTVIAVEELFLKILGNVS